jgi:hypothetical protein
MSEKVTLTGDNAALVKSIAAAGIREPQAVRMSLHHLTYAEATGGGEPTLTHFLLSPCLAEELGCQLLSAAREAMGQESH